MAAALLLGDWPNLVCGKYIKRASAGYLNDGLKEWLESNNYLQTAITLLDIFVVRNSAKKGMAIGRLRFDFRFHILKEWVIRKIGIFPIMVFGQTRGYKSNGQITFPSGSVSFFGRYPTVFRPKFLPFLNNSATGSRFTRYLVRGT